jgi:hypothetical protein
LAEAAATEASKILLTHIQGKILLTQSTSINLAEAAATEASVARSQLKGCSPVLNSTASLDLCVAKYY